MKSYPDFYDFMTNPDLCPFNDQGKFEPMYVRDRATEKLIYQEAREFKFEDTKQLNKLLRKEEMKRLKSRNNIRFCKFDFEEEKGKGPLKQISPGRKAQNERQKFKELILKDPKLNLGSPAKIKKKSKQESDPDKSEEKK